MKKMKNPSSLEEVEEEEGAAGSLREEELGFLIEIDDFFK